MSLLSLNLSFKVGRLAICGQESFALSSVLASDLALSAGGLQAVTVTASAAAARATETWRLKRVIRSSWGFHIWQGRTRWGRPAEHRVRTRAIRAWTVYWGVIASSSTSNTSVEFGPMPPWGMPWGP